ncbi:MAG: hypothetical protein GY859_36150, partial [Desulfobacterales bacterium]|nr:hypothetical protein [Desulfobacterales bacterium]
MYALYDLTISSASGGSVTAPGEGAFTYIAGTIVQLVASPDAGAEFVNWTGNVSTLADVDAATTSITMDGDYAVTANFAVNYAPTIQMYEPNGDDTADAVFFINWTDYDADDDAIVSLYYDTDGVGQDGVLIVTSIRENAADGFSWDVSGLANDDYYVYAVIDDGVNPPVVDYSDGPLTVYHPPTYHELTITSTFGGSVTAPGEGAFVYLAGTTVQLVASPGAGPEFVNWTGDVSTVADVNAATTTITINGHYAIIANFAVNDPPTIQMYEPDGDDAADAVFFINWTDYDADDDADVSLYYDTDGVGQDGVLIVASIKENAADGFSWDVSGLANGDYYVYAVIDDGVNPPVVDYSDGPLTVSHPTHFSTIWSGNPYFGMNLWARSAGIDGENLGVNDEIAVFDGEDCVGLGVVSGPITHQNPLIIHCSGDDGSGNGFTIGNAISFKIWDASEHNEIINITPQYLTTPEGDPISPPLFGSLMEYGVELDGSIAALQSIPLTAGWNMFSLYTLPENLDMLNIVQPLIDSGVLVKVWDENGKVVSMDTVRWVNHIGDAEPGKNYLINVTADSELVVEGSLVPLPLTIPLTAGWNYMGYPSPIARDAVSVLQPLIDAGVLMKAIDENGSNITESAGVWINQIGDFEGGEGYLVKVSADVDLTIDEAGAAPDGGQGDEVFRGQQGGPPSHFSLPWSGNPFFRMNLWIFGANGVALSAGDEIGIFDGDVCVGAGVLTGPLSVEN